MLKLLVLISGSGSNLRALLEATHRGDIPAEIVAVGADVEAAGLAHADEFDVSSFIVPPSQFESREAWGEALIANIEVFQPDLIVCAGFMRILPPNVIQRFSPNLINMHPALLPLYPGAHAVRDALLDGATETGCTVHIVDEGVDTGPSICQVPVPIEPGDTEETLHERIKIVERNLIVETVREISLHHINLQELVRS